MTLALGVTMAVRPVGLATLAAIVSSSAQQHRNKENTLLFIVPSPSVDWVVRCGDKGRFRVEDSEQGKPYISY